MELGGPVKEINYSKYKAGIIEEEHMLNLMQEKYSHVFYDYSVPSLHQFLVSCGVKFKEGPIEYSAFDRRP